LLNDTTQHYNTLQASINQMGTSLQAREKLTSLSRRSNRLVSDVTRKSATSLSV